MSTYFTWLRNRCTTQIYLATESTSMRILTELGKMRLAVFKQVVMGAEHSNMKVIMLS